MSKSMANFKRGLKKGSKAFLLSKELFYSPLGEKLRSNSKFKTCIRNNYFNVYWNGCSVLKYNPLARTHIYCIHHKYIGVDKHPSKSNPYIDLEPKFENDKLCDLTHDGWSFSQEILGTGRNGQMSPEVAKYIKGSEESEKKNLSQYLEVNNPCWLDLEVAFSRNKAEDNTIVADRIDLAVIEDSDVGKPVLKFIEVKMASDPRLKKQGDNLPSVCEKMSIYKNNFLYDQRDYLAESYKLVAQNMIDFGLAKDRKDLIERWINVGEVAPYPYLLVLTVKKRLAVHHCEKISEWMKANGFPVGSFGVYHLA